MAEATRLKGLVQAGIALSSQLSLDAVLQKIVETAADLTEAQYAALGVIDPTGRGLERFVYTGIDQETATLIGELPHGRGILGALITDAKPLRLEHLGTDPRSVGFPPNHPPMNTFLGVPILLRGVAYGNLYLTEKSGGRQFNEEDEELSVLLAAQAAVAVENARLYESATRWLRQLESLDEIAAALASEVELNPLLELVAGRLSELLTARIVLIFLRRGGTLTLEAAAGEGAGRLIGTELPIDGSKAGRVLERRHSERVDSMLDDLEVSHEVAREIGARTGLFVPLVVRGEAIGVLAAHDREVADARFTDEDLRLAEAFGTRAAVAIDLSRRVASDALRRVVGAQELERRRLARELHDETGQALASILLGLRGVESADTVDAAKQATEELRALVVATLQDVRRLALELRPKALDDFGLVPALERLTSTFAEQTGMTIELEARLGDERLPGEVETALYRITQEALTNVVKHAEARRVSVILTRRNGSVSTLIEDDGRGMPEETDEGGIGLIGMRERVALLNGRFMIESSPTGGTTVAVEVPL